MVIHEKKCLLNTICKESSIHGLSHIGNNLKLHLFERIIWVIIVTISFLCTLYICLSRWHRYESHSTLLGIETNNKHWIFPPIGITMCSKFIDNDTTIDLIERLWKINETHAKYEYYKEFLETIALTTYYNLNKYQRFVNDKSLTQMNMLEIALLMRGPLIRPPSIQYTNIITDVGICFSTTKLYYYQNPYGFYDKPEKNTTTISMGQQIQTIPIPEINEYKSMEQYYETNIIPHHLDSKFITIYFHNEYDVITDSASDIIKEYMIDDNLYEMQIQLNQIITTQQFHSLLPKYRKCLYYTEFTMSMSTYFNVYTINLCKINCRIIAALNKCGCIPFFYPVKNERICDANGLHCLAQTNWYNTTLCYCPPLCETITYEKLSTDVFIYAGQWRQMMDVVVNFPKIRIKREILYSFNNFLVSCAEATTLFLGCSVISIVEIFFFIIENLLRRCKQLIFKKN